MIAPDLTVIGCSWPGWTASPWRHARWGCSTEAEKAAGETELREVAGDHAICLLRSPDWRSARPRAGARSTKREGRPWPSCAGWQVPTRT